MPRIISIISFIFAGFFAITGLALLTQSLIAGFFSIVLAIAVFPQTKRFFQNKFKYTVSGRMKAAVIAGSFIGFLIFVPNAEIAPSIEDQRSIAQPVNQEVAVTVPKTVSPTQPDSPQNTPTESAGPEKINPSIPLAQSNLVKVVAVTDGDTIKVSINGTVKIVRMIGIDTPETVDPRKPVQCFGKEASNKTRDVLLNQMIELEPDPTQGDLDKYQRLIRYVILADGTNFGKYMIEQGYAHEYTYQIPYKYQAEFKVAEKEARENQRGLWNPAICNGATTSTANASEPNQPAQQQGAHTFYLSSHHSAKFYYCDSDDGWKSLSTDYLKSYSSEQELLDNYPTRTLHEACK